MRHFDEGTIHAWLDGALPSDEQTLIDAHVKECAECAALVAEARGLIAGAARIVRALDGVPASVVPRPQAPVAPRTVWRSLRLTPLRAAMAASLMIATASMFVIRHRPVAPLVETTHTEVAPATAPVAAPLSPVADAPREPVDRAKRPPATKVAENVAAAPPQAADAPQAASSQPDSSRGAAATKQVVAVAKAVDASAREAEARARDDSARADATVAPAFARSSFASGAGARQALMDAVAERPDAAARLFAGCYQIARDSSSLNSAIPERFALDRIGTASTVRYVVRAVNGNGAMDSALASATWEPRAAGTVTVLWTGRDGGEQLHLTALPGGRVSGVAAVGSSAKPLQVSKVICNR